MIRRSVLIGTGSALPRRVVSNAELAERVDTSDEWIVERTGIRNRHIAGEDETTGTLAILAAQRALEAAGLPFRKGTSWRTVATLVGREIFKQDMLWAGHHRFE